MIQLTRTVHTAHREEYCFSFTEIAIFRSINCLFLIFCYYYFFYFFLKSKMTYFTISEKCPYCVQSQMGVRY